MSEIVVENDKEHSLIKFKFTHSLLKNELTCFLTNEVNADLVYSSMIDKPFPMITQLVRAERSNPFEYGLPVSGASFYGYEKEIEEWAAKLLKQGASLTITGARRMGKSSFRLQLGKKLAEEKNVVVVQFDIERNHTKKAAFYRSIVDNLPSALEKKHLLGINVSSLYDLCNSPADVFFKGLINLLEHHQIANPVLVLILDEFGKIYGTVNEKAVTHSIIAGELNSKAIQSADKVFNHLTELMEKYGYGQIRLVLVGLPWHFSPPIDAAHSSGIERYFNRHDHMIHIGQMNVDVINELIKSKLESEDVEITDDALSYCLELSCSVPNDAQLIMSSAFNKALADNKETVAIKPIINKKHLDSAKEQLKSHYRQFHSIILSALDKNISEDLKKEACEITPKWEREWILLDNKNDLAPFDKMGYWNWRTLEGKGHRKVLFIPKGLTLLIKE